MKTILEYLSTKASIVEFPKELSFDKITHFLENAGFEEIKNVKDQYDLKYKINSLQDNWYCITQDQFGWYMYFGKPGKINNDNPEFNISTSFDLKDYFFSTVDAYHNILKRFNDSNDQMTNYRKFREAVIEYFGFD